MHRIPLAILALFAFYKVCYTAIGSDEIANQLFSAAASGRIGDLKKLHENGADLKATDESGLDALYLAAYYGKNEVIKYLIDNEVDVSRLHSGSHTPLSGASSQGQLESMRILIDAGADLNTTGTRDWNINTPVAASQAVSEGQVEALKLLIDHGINIGPDYPDTSKLLLTLALFSPPRTSELTRVLLESGLSPSSSLSDEFGNSVTSLLARHGQHEALSQIIKAGAKLDTINNAGRTVLMEAVSSGNIDCVNLLLVTNVEKEAKDKDGNTLSDFAVLYGFQDIYTTLVDNGVAHSKNAFSPKIKIQFIQEALGVLGYVNEIEKNGILNTETRDGINSFIRQKNIFGYDMNSLVKQLLTDFADITLVEQGNQKQIMAGPDEKISTKWTISQDGLQGWILSNEKTSKDLFLPTEAFGWLD